jgi:putative acetyltransferase
VRGGAGNAAAIAQESPFQEDVLALLAQSDAFSAALYPPESNHTIGARALGQPGVRFFVARHDGAAVGCAALVLGRRGEAELKRMFVAEGMRGSGIGFRLLAAVETAAQREGVRVLRLETGVASAGALALYRRAGYRERGPFGAYGPDPLSVFMERELPKTTAA